MKINTIIILAILIVFGGSCKKEPEAPTAGNKILIGITTSDTISYLFAKVSTQLSSTGGNQIIQHGHCWSAGANPDTGDAHTSLGSIASPGNFTSDLSGLSDNIKYYIRPYTTFLHGTVYGFQKEITTLKRGKPVAITGTTSYITTTSVKINGTATFDSGFAITQKGICWDTVSNPTLLKCLGHSEEGKGTGSFTSSISSLTENKQYYFSAYATNEKGTSYGETKQFITTPIIKPTVLTNNITNITGNTATSGGNVTNDGNGTVGTRGVCWNKTGAPTLTNCINKTQDGTGTGSYTSQITGLIHLTTYYLVAYATNEKGTAYGNEVTFTTLANLPNVTTTEVTNINQTTAISGGTIISDGGATITARGVCYNTSPNPTLSSSHTSDGTGTGVFWSYLSGLNRNTIYYVRAYATNSIGTSYGNQVIFKTLADLTITTTAITNITQTTATSGGNITSDGGAAITARGVCWSNTPNPTISGSHTSDGSGTGIFVSNLTSLTPNMNYYVRAYATNSMGTVYGNQVSFTSLAWSCGSTIIINHVAGTIAPVTKTVTYGTVTNIPGEPTKCWITSNLGANHQATSIDDATEASAGWYWQFNRKQGYKHDGTLRTPNIAWITSIDENSNWQVSTDPCSNELGSNWRIPTSAEWANVDASGGWTNPAGPWGSTLKIHAAGYLDFQDGALKYRGSGGDYWSSTQHLLPIGWSLHFNSAFCGIHQDGKSFGFSLRCLRND